MDTIIFFISVSAIVVVYGVLAYAWYSLKTLKQLKNQQSKFNKIMQSIKVGDRVLVSSGLIGKIKSINNEVFELECGDKIILESSIYSIQDILSDK